MFWRQVMTAEGMKPVETSRTAAPLAIMMAQVSFRLIEMFCHPNTCVLFWCRAAAAVSQDAASRSNQSQGAHGASLVPFSELTKDCAQRLSWTAFCRGPAVENQF